MRQGQSIGISTIIYVAIALLVLVIISVLVYNAFVDTQEELDSCDGAGHFCIYEGESCGENAQPDNSRECAEGQICCTGIQEA